jgi:hypothetical protein
MESKCAWGSEMALTMDGTHETIGARTAGEKKKKNRPPEDAAVFGAQHCNAAAHLEVLHCNFEAST